MIIDVKYKAGDSIKYIERRTHEVFGPCPCCDGDGYITGADGEKYTCPYCEGSKQVRVGEMDSEEEKTGTIKSVHVHFDSDIASYHGKPGIYYCTPQNSFYHINQEDVIEKIFDEEE